MKRLILSLLAIAATTTSFAQVRFGVLGGLNLANQHLKVTVGSLTVGTSGDAIASFHVGGMAEIPVAKNFSILPRLILTGKGANFKGDSDVPGSTDETTKMRPFYLEMPVNVVYKYTLPNKMKLIGGFGPSFAMGIFGKAKSGNLEDDVFQDGGFRRFDFGLNYLIGAEFTNQMMVSINYTQGLSNTLDTDDSDIKWKNRVWGLSVGYFFGR